MSAARNRAERPWIIKIGSALLTADGRGLDEAAIGAWVDQIEGLRGEGVPTVIVSSGAIAEGMSRMRLTRRPEALYELQALAAVGQTGLIQSYETSFQRHGTHTAQILLTHEDFSERGRYLNARSTLRTLLRYGVVPVVNENDTVATHEARLGDNDTLAALVANLLEASTLVILTDQQGLYSADPRRDAGAALIEHARAGDPALQEMAGEGGSLGRGGMLTKLRAAELAARSGTVTRIASGREPEVLRRIARGEAVGTELAPGQAPLAARKRWLAGQLSVRGRLTLDEGASKVVRTEGRSLLAVGVRAVSGAFSRGDMVACDGPDGEEIARGLVNYGAEETRRIMGQASDRIASLIGYVDEPELIHRDNLVLTGE